MARARIERFGNKVIKKGTRLVSRGTTKPTTLSEHADDLLEEVSEKVEENLPALNTWADFLITWFKKKCAKAFLETYGFDGYVITQKGIVTPHGIENFKSKSLSLSIIITSLWGLPNRLNFDKQLPGLQIWRDLIGGWVPINRDRNGKAIWTEKHRWQIFAIPVKFLIILPVKLLTLTFKFLVNMVKAYTEFLPMLLRAIADVLLRTLLKHGDKAINTEMNGAALFFTGLGLVVAGVLVGLFYLSTLALHFLGRALTSPEKSARILFEFAQKYTEQVVGKTFSIVIGVFLGLVSVLTSAALWAITLPVLISAVANYIPITVEAAAWVSQLPVINSILAALNSVSLIPWFGQYLAKISALSSYFGVQLVSTSTVLMVAAFGYVAAPICSILSRVAEELSNWWAVSGWDSKKGGPLTTLASLGPNQDDASLADIKLRATLGGKTSSTTTPSSRAKQLAQSTKLEPINLEGLAEYAEGSGKPSAKPRTHKSNTRPTVPASAKSKGRAF